eukprot:scaffold16286_cov61-Phaeocystis_antarctica.AAC.4
MSIDPGQQRMGSGSSRGRRMTNSFCECRGGMRRVSRGRSASSCTAACRSRADPVVTFLALEASRQLVNVRYDGDRDFFIICSNGLDMKTLAH